MIVMNKDIVVIGNR